MNLIARYARNKRGSVLCSLELLKIRVFFFFSILVGRSGGLLVIREELAREAEKQRHQDLSALMLLTLGPISALW